MERDADPTREEAAGGTPLGAFSERVTTPDLLSEGPVRFLLVSGDQDDGGWGLVGSFWLSIDGDRGGCRGSARSAGTPPGSCTMQVCALLRSPTSYGAITADGGLDIPALEHHVDHTGSVVGFDRADEFGNAALLTPTSTCWFRRPSRESSTAATPLTSGHR